MGQFSLLWIDQMQRYNFDVDVFECEWGTGVDLELLKEKLQSDRSHSVKAVCVVHNETSTGVTNDIGAVRKVLGKTTLPRHSPQPVCSIAKRFSGYGIAGGNCNSEMASPIPLGRSPLTLSSCTLKVASWSG